ncbi:hypothetical protein EC973_006663 [Apophysomyces ossiformis]|uniref:Long-chain-fatty-acid--CoA ligase n=1 Tax=Apophysomyces ossiformis TaxID=679940 RepID=A0A8H7EQZ6_9FUNG|nr:hypothetical protein EC973_006663 [Apophysomyces ossiformis]
MAKYQSRVLPNSQKPGQTGIYRGAEVGELVSFPSLDVKTVYDLFATGCKISRERPCLGTRKVINRQTGQIGEYEWQTYSEVRARVDNFGSGLLELVKSHESRHIGVWAVNRPEWTITDLACAAYGLTSVAIYDTLGPDTVEFVINHAEIQIIVCSSDHVIHLLKLKHLLPDLKVIISMDSLQGNPEIVPTGKINTSGAILTSWAEEKGIRLLDFVSVEKIGDNNRRPHAYAKPDDLFCIMYTSGTTGMPKGAMLSHINILSAVGAVQANVSGNAQDRLISYLPLAHIYGRLAEHLLLYLGGEIGYYSGIVEQLVEDVQTLKPTIFCTVPRLLNRVYAAVAAKSIDASGIKGVIARKAVAAKLERLERTGQYTHEVWDRLLFNKVKQALGGRVRMMCTGSAPIAPDVLQFIRVAFCCDVSEGYGATETTAASSQHQMGEARAGHVGRPLRCNEIKLVDVPEMNYLSTDEQPRGEICLRGPNIFMGYYKDDEKTLEAVDEEGWYHSGDIGLIDEHGCLVVIDRKKNIFKLAHGEYIAPEKIENVFVKDPAVAQIFVHGDSIQSHLVAIVVPDPEGLRNLIRSLNKSSLDLAEMCRHPDVVRIMRDHIVKLGKQAGLHGFELPRAIFLEPEPFSIENNLLTPTFKIKRAQAKQHYQIQIEKLYEQITESVEPGTAKL